MIESYGRAQNKRRIRIAGRHRAKLQSDQLIRVVSGKRSSAGGCAKASGTLRRIVPGWVANTKRYL
jgi:hypothetical protein